ncbi:MAG: YicC family protein [Candidatus Brocadiaceae bacterium]|nr:YicC family protein [Candidatus Brocadiaceae bacterium]
MLKSMTGFGIAEFKDEECTVRVELRSVNNKFLKITSRLPDILQPFENELERPIRKKIIRGSVILNVNYKSLHKEPEYVVSRDRLKEYYQLLNEVKNEIGSKEEISVNSLLMFPGILQKGNNLQWDADRIFSHSVGLINEALDRMIEMRCVEGAYLEKDIEQRKTFVFSMLEKFETRMPIVVQEYSQRLQNRITSLLAGMDIGLEYNDLYREIAIFAERSDIAEEISRLKSHLHQLQDTIALNEPVGRKLDFIVQEMFRETNTMCSKANDSLMLKDLVNVKTEIEKIREQVLNIE